MERLLSSLYAQGDSRTGGGDSFVDHLSCRHTVFILAIFAIGVTTKQWLGDVPISCWCPAHFTSSHVEYTNRVCWTQNTYYLPITEHRIPKSNKGKAYISYYQWVALVLLCQAIMFYLPRPLWLILSKKSGISISSITDAAMECQKSLDPDNREKIMTYIVKDLGRFLVEHARNCLMANKVQDIWWAFYGSFLLIVYIIIKLVYLANVISQLLLINKFLGTEDHMYGFKVLSQMLKGERWRTSDRFPRVTLCDISVRQLGNIHNYTLQCSLPMNLFNEKIYIFIWFWFAMVAFVTCASLFHWIWCSVYMPGQVSHIRQRLIALNKLITEEDENLVDKFVRIYLRRDGLFIIRMITKNSSEVIAAQLICGMFDHFKDNRLIIQQLNTRGLLKAKTKEIKKKLINRSLTVETDLKNLQEDEVT